MQLHENIPTLGGLGEPPPRSRREQLGLDGQRAKGEIVAFLRRARSRARLLSAARGLALLLAGLLLAALAGALLASVDGTLLARAVALLLAAGAIGGVVWFSLRSPLQTAAARARHPALLARLLGGPSELLSSVELASERTEGVSTELLALLHVRAAAAARAIDVRRALPASSLRGPLAALAGCALLWGLAAWLAPRNLAQGAARLLRGENGAPTVELSP
ncbi:MAG TPA: hypothetical protein VFE90_03090, partial [Myxococcales bacterium]|nr:hypothetical protein [Myxococcales bacterium]